MKPLADVMYISRSFQPQFGPQYFFFVFVLRFQLYQMLDIVSSWNLAQCQGKLMMQPWENDKNTNFGPNFGLQNFLYGFYL